MKLQTQIYTLLFSFFFGIVFSFLISINYKWLYHEKKKYKITSTFMIVIGCIIIYFIGIRKINDGIMHPYSFVVILLGFLVEHFLHTLVSFQVKKIAFFTKK